MPSTSWVQVKGNFVACQRKKEAARKVPVCDNQVSLALLLIFYSFSVQIFPMVNSVEIRCTKDGPNLAVVDGNVFAAMCRCGASTNKPQCDGTHRKINFKAEEKTIKVV